jgi:hypothetical protein
MKRIAFLLDNTSREHVGRMAFTACTASASENRLVLIQYPNTAAADLRRGLRQCVCEWYVVRVSLRVSYCIGVIHTSADHAHTMNLERVLNSESGVPGSYTQRHNLTCYDPSHNAQGQCSRHGSRSG